MTGQLGPRIVVRGEGTELKLRQTLRLVFQGGVSAVSGHTFEEAKEGETVLRLESGVAMEAAAVVMDNGVLRKEDEMLMVLEILPVQMPKKANKDAVGRAVVFRRQKLPECADGEGELKPQRWVLNEKNHTLSPHHMPKYSLGWGMNPELEEVGLTVVKLYSPEEVRLVSTGRVASDDGLGNATNASCG